MNLNDFSYEENDRRYINPEVSLNEQNAFIQNLRDTQAERNAQIKQDTHDLGTDVPSNLGGLTGSEAYFNARYQTPQTNAIIADLKATAQAQALNNVMSNELEKAKKRYNDAYRAAKKRSSGGTTADPDDSGTGDIEYEASDKDIKELGVSKVTPNYSPMTGTWEYTVSGLGNPKIYVEYDEYGHATHVVDNGRANEYSGEDAAAYWNKIKGATNFKDSKRIK